MMHVVICDDEPCFQEAVVNAVKKWMCTSGHSDIRCTVFSSSEDLLERWSNGLSIDFFFWTSKFRAKSAAWHWLKKFATPIIIFPLYSLQIT